ncbi:hypothetical protein BB560_000886 [Smittium megazygosporum]|uniref:Protein arginine N-methyltransferase domain-containing protein n=1 Tax=Smittium megazygosporum TaxID=133381 RepID=A0A2T9ZJ13_9FUNG|nr:hypothetical protein BB560_000886 [Smittium megazygosporum]
MLDSVLVARDKYLDKSTGILAPSSSAIYLVGIQDDEFVDYNINFWNSVYGFSMTPMKEGIHKDAVVTHVPANTVATDIATIASFDHLTCTPADLDFQSPFCLKIERDTARIHAFAGSFDTFFSPKRSKPDHENNSNVFPSDSEVVLSTKIGTKPTHWKQTIFLIEKPLDLKKGDLIVGIFNCKKSISNPRELDIQISYSLLSAENQESVFSKHSSSASLDSTDFITSTIFTEFAPLSQTYSLK